jgi:hypothetical protein
MNKEKNIKSPKNISRMGKIIEIRSKLGFTRG